MQPNLFPHFPEQWPASDAEILIVELERLAAKLAALPITEIDRMELRDPLERLMMIMGGCDE